MYIIKFFSCLNLKAVNRLKFEFFTYCKKTHLKFLIRVHIIQESVSGGEKSKSSNGRCSLMLLQLNLSFLLIYYRIWLCEIKLY